MKKRLAVIVSLASTALAASAAYSNPAYEFISTPISYDSQLSLGFQFTTTQSVDVTALGYWDYQDDGFATPHEVGIFDSEGNLVADAMLSAGTADPLVDQFRYAGINPVILGAGRTYTIAATTFGPFDPWAYGNGYGLSPAIIGFSLNPEITVDTNGALFVYQSDNVLRDPTFHFSDYTVYAGPNFLVPEPATFALIGAGLLLLWGFGLMRRRADFGFSFMRSVYRIGAAATVREARDD